MTLLIVALVSIGVFAAVMMVGASVSKKDVTEKKLKQLVSPSKEEEEFDKQTKTALASGMEKSMGVFGVKTDEGQSETDAKLIQAGVLSANSKIYYLFMKTAGPILGFFLAIILVSGAEEGGMKLLSVLIAVAVLIGGFFGADILLRNKKQKRQQVLQRSFPDALDLLLVCVESGLALDAALSRVCKELGVAHPEITKELNQTRMELTLLGDREKALQNLAERTDMVPFRALVAALIQTEKFGTNLADTLRVLSEDYRNTRLMIAENKAGRLPVLIAIPMMLFMIPALMIMIVSPAILTLFTS